MRYRIYVMYIFNSEKPFISNKELCLPKLLQKQICMFYIIQSLIKWKAPLALKIFRIQYTKMSYLCSFFVHSIQNKLNLNKGIIFTLSCKYTRSKQYVMWNVYRQYNFLLLYYINRKANLFIVNE